MRLANVSVWPGDNVFSQKLKFLLLSRREKLLGGNSWSLPQLFLILLRKMGPEKGGPGKSSEDTEPAQTQTPASGFLESLQFITLSLFKHVGGSK